MTDRVALLGIDAGTTSMKAAVFDLDGHMLGMDLQEYDLLAPGPALVELEPETYWKACCQAVRNAVERAGSPPIAALSISSQGETLIPVDAAGRPTRRAIVWLDNRAVDEARYLAERFDADTIYHTTGQAEITPTWPACKLLWIQRHEPQVWASSSRFLLLEDYLLYRLTGRFVTEYSMQSDSLLLDIVRGEWWAPMLDAIGLTPDRLPELVPPGTIVGPLSAEGREALGIRGDGSVVAGAMDQFLGAVGAGNVAPGVVTETTGGALAVVVTLEEPRFDPQRRVPCHYHAQPNLYALLPWSQTAGMAYRWFRDQFYQVENVVAGASGMDGYVLMDRAAARVPAGSDGLVVLPHLEGAACPEFNPAARAVFFGATLRHTKAHFARGIMESVAYMLRRDLDLVQQLGVEINEVRSIGGGAHSKLWLQIKADVLQKPLNTVEVDEVACLGACIVAANAIGAVPGLAEAVARMVRPKETILPRAENAAVYDCGYATYTELYSRLEPMFLS
ncbi:MAG: xylulokinase [Anaerolineae bacterium]